MSVITKGKYAVLEAGALPHLIALCTDTSSEVRTNAVKVSVLFTLYKITAQWGLDCRVSCRVRVPARAFLKKVFS